ncbi:SDR family oxidoreductase [Pseudonocardia sp. MCCB 268]|nr:SDR family oxidoreductase [Pseudonocardia cytotoxica]
MTRTLAAVEWGLHGVTVNAVSLTVVPTSSSGGRCGTTRPGDAHRAEIPARRFAERRRSPRPWCTWPDEAAMVNGAELKVDGGLPRADRRAGVAGGP